MSFSSDFPKLGVDAFLKICRDSRFRTNLNEGLWDYLSTEGNLLKYSEQIDNSAWTKTQCSVDPTPVVAPDGTTTAEKIIASGVVDPFVWQPVVQDPIGKTYTFSIWLWTDAGQPTDCELYVYGGTSGVLTDIGSKLITLTTSPQRFTFTQTFASSATTTVGRFDLPQLAAAGEYVYAWGAQMNMGSVARPYTKTEASSISSYPQATLNDKIAAADAASFDWVLN